MGPLGSVVKPVLLGLGLIALTAGCGPCSDSEGTCVELRVEGSGRYNQLELEWRYPSNLYPIGSIVRGALAGPVELPRSMRLSPPALVPPDTLTSVGARAIPPFEPDAQLAGSALVPDSHDARFGLRVPLSLKFKQVVLRETGPLVLSTVLHDLNQDGVLDIINSIGGELDASGQPKPTSKAGVEVHYQQADGRFSPPALLAGAPTSTVPVIVAEFDGNTTNGPEILVPSGGPSVVFTRRDGSLYSPSPGLTYTGTPQVIVGAQLDNQGSTDLAVLGYQTPSTQTLTAWSFSATAAMQRVAPKMFTGMLTPAVRAVAADFDGNGFVDVAYTRAGESGRGLLLVPNLGNFNLGALVTYVDLGATPSSLVSGDLNGDQKADVVVASTWDQSLSVWLGAADGTLRKQSTTYLGTGFLTDMELAAADFDADGRIDIAVLNEASPSVAVLPGDGTGRLGAPIRFALRQSGVTLAAADLDRNGRPDLVIATVGGGFLLFMNQPL